MRSSALLYNSEVARIALDVLAKASGQGNQPGKRRSLILLERHLPSASSVFFATTMHLAVLFGAAFRSSSFGRSLNFPSAVCARSSRRVKMSRCLYVKFDLLNTSGHSSCPDAKDGKKRSSSDGASAGGPLSGGANPSSGKRRYFPDACRVLAFEGIGEERNAAIGTTGSLARAGWLVAKASSASRNETSVRGTGGSNPPLSATESFSAYSFTTNDRNPRQCGKFRTACGTGEWSKSSIPPIRVNFLCGNQIRGHCEKLCWRQLGY